jgi:hypothetical protein
MHWDGPIDDQIDGVGHAIIRRSKDTDERFRMRRQVWTPVEAIDENVSAIITELVEDLWPDR